MESLGAVPWSSESTPEILKLGYEAAPESTCIPFKACLGHFMKAALDGVEYGIIVNSVGTCRLRYYRMLQQKIFNKLNKNIYIFGLGYDGFKPPLIRYFDPSVSTFVKGVARAIKKMHMIDIIEQKAWKTRSVEIRTGDTTKLMSCCLRELEKAKTIRDIKKLKLTIPERFSKIPINKEKKTLKVALIGEASVLRDKYLNHNIEDLLGRTGVEVFNFFLLGAELKKIFKIDFRNKNSRKNRMKIARPYLKSIVGGHALESVANTIRCANEGYNGVVHMCPSGCMPEVSIRPILRKISQDYNIPILECSFDEHTNHVGFVTRLEAFVDILHNQASLKKNKFFQPIEISTR